MYADDGAVLPPNGIAVQGRQAIQKWLGEFPPISDFKLEPVDVDGRGDIAYARGNYSMTLSPPGVAPIRDHGKWVEVWRKQADGSWKMRWDIFNSDVPAGPGQ
jgi:ketosteroid isomerase-like protein